jgi:hypothetical protein
MKKTKSSQGPSGNSGTIAQIPIKSLLSDTDPLIEGQVSEGKDCVTLR